MTPAAEVSLDLVLPHLSGPWAHCEVGDRATLFGRVDAAGSPAPLPSSAAPLRLGGHEAWFPAPDTPADPATGSAPVYRHAGRPLVLPLVRLLRPGAAPDDPPAVTFLALPDWLRDALTVWRFAAADPDPAAPGEPRTVAEHLENERASVEGLRLMAFAVRYAVFGSDRWAAVGGLRFPPAPAWVRPAGGSRLARSAARRLVVTAREPGPGRPPAADVRGVKNRIAPVKDSPDYGIDPVHTPESEAVRLTGRLAVGARVEGGKLVRPGALGVPLSVSAARIPYAGFDDPRRLLMGANMQTQAVRLAGRTEEPLVRVDASGDDPPGVNLRVGYLAWEGLNHEDAWVLSESAAARLAAEEVTTYTIPVRWVEQPRGLRVRVGQEVRPGDLLYRRRVAPALVAPPSAAARYPTADGELDLRPEPGDQADHGGRVVLIERWVFRADRVLVRRRRKSGGRVKVTRSRLAARVAPELPGVYRGVYRVRVRRTLPLAVGDKLANRHGHKGVVGAILPDRLMPRWRDPRSGESLPLDALLDPTGVFNRSNWGQVYETLAGATGGGYPDPGEVAARVVEHNGTADGRWPVELPARTVEAVVGVQFVMRMPQHAADKLAACPAPGSPAPAGVRTRPQRFGEMDRWAVWAHGVARPPGDRPSAAAIRLRSLLAAAGYDCRVEPGRVLLGRLPLDGSAQGKPFPLVPGGAEGSSQGDAAAGRETLADLYDRADEFAARHDPAVLVFREPIEVRAPGPVGGSGSEPDRLTVAWLPLLPPSVRPARQAPGFPEEPHRLTVYLRWVLRAARDRLDPGTRVRNRQAAADPVDPRGELVRAVEVYMQAAYTRAVGRTGRGPDSGKYSALRREVFGGWVRPSGRAVITPASPLDEHPLGLDEVALPRVLCEVLFGSAEKVEGKSVWLKRDPVLHRWGLVRVRVRQADGDTIRLPASLLGPLGADFDGDTVAVFPDVPAADAAGAGDACRPSALAAHDQLPRRAMFVPGKQYVHGLRLLADDEAGWARFMAAPEVRWPTDVPDRGSKEALERWVCAAGEAAAKDPEAGRWWAVVEEFAVRGLAADPGMGLRLFHKAAEVAEADAVRHRAAKPDLFAPGSASARLVDEILAGRSLDAFGSAPPGGAVDPIASVMVAGKLSVGRYGGVLRRLLLSAGELTPETVRRVQTLTEQATQKALSVKVGDRPLSFAAFDRWVRQLIRPRKGGATDRRQDDAVTAPAGLTDLSTVWEKLRDVPWTPDAAWLTWFRAPERLALLVRDGAELGFPADDLRGSGWYPLQ